MPPIRVDKICGYRSTDKDAMMELFRANGNGVTAATQQVYYELAISEGIVPPGFCFCILAVASGKGKAVACVNKNLNQDNCIIAQLADIGGAPEQLLATEIKE